MEVLKAEIARKRKLLEQKQLVDDKRNIFAVASSMPKTQRKCCKRWDTKSRNLLRRLGQKALTVL